MIYFDSDMSKSINTVILFDWNTVIYIYVCGKCRTQFMLSMEKSVTFTGTCANEIIPSINRSFVCKGHHVRINCIICSLWKSLNSESIIPPISTKQTSTSHFNSLNIKKTTTYDVRIPTWNRHKNVPGLCLLMRSQPPTCCDSWISNNRYKLTIKNLIS